MDIYANDYEKLNSDVSKVTEMTVLREFEKSLENHHPVDNFLLRLLPHHLYFETVSKTNCKC